MPENSTAIDLSSYFNPKGSGVNYTVGVLEATDPDTDEEFVFNLVSGQGDQENEFFEI